MRLASIIIITLILISFSAIGQTEIQEGFALLDQGEFSKAEELFSDLNQNDPDNTSVQIGYGRALGLGGQTQKANQFFKEKLAQQPEHLELQLNYSESLLWMGDTKKARDLYQKINIDHPQNFVGFIGMGNALSIDKEYKSAIIHYKKAAILNPELEYIQEQIYHAKMAYAYQFKMQNELDSATIIYNDILIETPEDIEAQQALGDIYMQKKKYKEAYIIFDSLQYQEGKTKTSLLRMSSIKNFLHQPKAALHYAEKALEKDSLNYGMEEYLETATGYFYALLWNNKISKAEQYLQTLQEKYPNHKALITPSTQLYLYQGKFKNAEDNFDIQIENDSTSFDGNLGAANLAFGLGDYTHSKHLLKTTFSFYPNQSDALSLQQKINQETAVQLTTGVEWLKDNGDNNQLAYFISTKIPVGNKWSILGSYKNYNANNTFFEDEGKIHYANIGLSYIQKRWNITLMGGPTFGEYEKTSKHNSFTFDFKAKYIGEKRNEFTFIAHQKIYDYTASLISKDINFTNVGIEYNGNIKNTIGVFGQYFHTFYSDNNSRESLLASFYYNIKSAPVIKTGINTQLITFKDQIPADYYSPKTLTILEGFFEFNSLVLQDKKWGIRLELVPGLLMEKDNSPKFNYRATSEFIVRPTKNFHIKAKAMTGRNITVDNNGYTMWQAELKMVYYFTK